MKLSFCEVTEKGHRKVNEDFSICKVTDECSLFVLADGLGAHLGGAHLAQAFCEAFIGLFDDFVSNMESDASAEASILCWYNKALEQMKIEFSDDALLQEAHTTFVATYLSQSKMVTLHIGDSRVYKITEKTTWRSADHSVPQVLFDEGIISENEISSHKHQNLLTKSISLNEQDVPVVTQLDSLERGETVVLCTDGFWAFTTEAELRKMQGIAPDEKVLRQQIKTILKRAKRQSDNITVQWVCNI